MCRCVRFLQRVPDESCASEVVLCACFSHVQAWLEQKREILKIGETAVKAALKQHDILDTAIRPSKRQLRECALKVSAARYSVHPNLSVGPIFFLCVCIAQANEFLDAWQRNYTGAFERCVGSFGIHESGVGDNCMYVILPSSLPDTTPILHDYGIIGR